MGGSSAKSAAADAKEARTKWQWFFDADADRYRLLADTVQQLLNRLTRLGGRSAERDTAL